MLTVAVKELDEGRLAPWDQEARAGPAASTGPRGANAQ